MLKAVVDTNVFVSALLGSPQSSALIASFARGRFVPLLSVPLLAELRDVLQRPRLGLRQLDANTLLGVLLERAEMVTPHKTPSVCRDPKDDMLFACALAGKADVIVTGDADVLTLHPFHNIAILTPSQFITHLRHR